MLKVKWFVVVGVLTVGLMGGVGVIAQEVASKDKPKVEKKVEVKLPAEVAIPEARVDKTRVLVLERTLLLQQLDKIKSEIETREIKLQAEMVSALDRAGVAKEDHGKYQINLETLKISLVESATLPMGGKGTVTNGK
jgi:hypothetical protein